MVDHDKKAIYFLAGLLLFACDSEEEIRREIQTAIDQGVEATRTKNIELYMEGIPSDFIIRDESGEIVTREKQREYTLRDWSIIDTTINIFCKIDSLKVLGDSAIVYNSQRWERLMFRRNGITKDTIVTTQIHKEIWKKKNRGWHSYEVEELGGEVFINGERYDSQGH